MNPANLMLSAAIASLMLFSPAAFTTADAASFKIKPQIVKVRPKIVVAKPKVRVKVRTAKIRIKPKVKVKVRAAKVRMKPRLQLTTVKLHRKPRVTPKVAVSQKAKAALTLAALNSHSRAGRKLLPELPNTGPLPTPSNPSGGPKVSVGNSTPGTGLNKGFTHPTKAPNTPTLEVPGGFLDVLEASGGVLNDEFRHANDLDALRGLRAIEELFYIGLGSGNLPSGSDGFGGQRVGAGFDGPLMGAADAPGRTEFDANGSSGSSGSGGPWTGTSTEKTEDGGTRTTLTRTNSNGGTDTMTKTENPNGTVIIEQTTEDKDGSSGITVVVAPDSDGDGSSFAHAYETRDGEMVPGSEFGTTTTTGSVATPMDRNGDGRPDQTVYWQQDPNRKGPPIFQPAPHDNETGHGKNAGKWTPFGGYASPSHTFFDTISQPGTDEQGTVTFGGSARPNAGPGAVTNGGDGGFVAGGNTGGSGGFGHDPCATIKGGGCGGSGPDAEGPQGTPPSRS